MSDTAISIRDVSKRFRINQDRQSSLKERAVNIGRPKRGHKDFWALRGIDVDVAQGETLGLIGHNGSGKSTLLKCVGGILAPTEGEIRVRGRIASLLELGAGFHPDLTGRENVFLNASILGMSRKDIAERFDDIVAFAEMERFIDEQVKHYSSGMYVRLGFAVAINVEPDVLLVDEVLSVGDEAFQQKCLEKVRGFQREGRTIIFVSHGTDLVRRICDRVLVLDHGEPVALGEPADAILTFREHIHGGQAEEEHQELSHGHRVTGQVRIEEVRASWPGSTEHRAIAPGQPLTIAMRYATDDPIDDIVFAMEMRNLDDVNVYGCNSDVLEQPVGGVHGTGWVRFEIPSLDLIDGQYTIDVGCHTHDIITEYDFVHEAVKLTVVGAGSVVGIANLHADVTHTADA